MRFGMNPGPDKGFRIAGGALLLAALLENPWTLSKFLPASSRLLNLSSYILLWGLAAVMTALGLYLLLRAPRALRREIPNLALMAASGVLGLFLMEAVLRLMTPTPIFHPDLALYPYKDLLLRTSLLGIPAEVRHTTNAWGMRGDPIPEDWDERFTILAVGGSTTHCYFLPDESTWPARLQQRLRKTDPRIMVQNAGLDGHSTRGHLLMTEKVVPRLEPEIVIYLVGLNDLSHSINEQHLLFGNPNERTGLGYFVYAHSRLAQRVHRWFQVFVNKAPAVVEMSQLSPDGYHRKPLDEPTPLPARLESLLPSLQEYRENLAAILDRTEAQEVSAVFLTQPILFDDTPEWENVKWDAYWLGRQKYEISAATFARMLGIFNDALLDFCEARGTRCFDLAREAPHEQKYFYDAVHFNEAGAARVGRVTAAFLRDEALVP